MRPPDLPGGNGGVRVGRRGGVQASMRPPDLPGGNANRLHCRILRHVGASMRPPDLPGGNCASARHPRRNHYRASMRPPDLPGGNTMPMPPCATCASSFNEAAGFTRRKPQRLREVLIYDSCFNEAAGFTRRKRRNSRSYSINNNIASMRPPDLPGGNAETVFVRPQRSQASMRPPDLPGGNRARRRRRTWRGCYASMRPPDLPGGNSRALGHGVRAG